MSKWKDKTRNRTPVRIYAEDGHSGWEIHGAMKERGGWVVREWHLDGTCPDHDSDLIPNTPEIDWSKQPDWCKAIAMNMYGRWRRYNYTTTIGEHRWKRPLDIGIGDYFSQPMHPSEYPAWSGDWKDSLCVRPEGEPA